MSQGKEWENALQRSWVLAISVTGTLWCFSIAASKGEMLLMYDMPNGSLDRYQYNEPKANLTRSQIFRVIRSVAYGLHYLHAGWELEVILKDVKLSNILLDLEVNGKLGDFGSTQSRHQSTYHPTLGYLAPKSTRSATATNSNYVFAFVFSQGCLWKKAARGWGGGHNIGGLGVFLLGSRWHSLGKRSKFRDGNRR